MFAELPAPAGVPVCVTSLPGATDVPGAAQDPGRATCPERAPGDPAAPAAAPFPLSMVPPPGPLGPYVLQTPSVLAGLHSCLPPTHSDSAPGEAELLWVEQRGPDKPRTDLGAPGPLCTCQGGCCVAQEQWPDLSEPPVPPVYTGFSCGQPRGPTGGQGSGPPTVTHRLVWAGGVWGGQSPSRPRPASPCPQAAGSSLSSSGP